MLDMLGEDARAAVGKVKQLQSQGATPDQVQAQMMEAARNGLLPISVAFAAQKALQRKNPPAPPAQGTVMSEMLSQLQQSQNPREQGIAGLDNPVMDNAQYAGGGIVAFDVGGGLPLSTSRTRPNVFAGGPEARAAAVAEAERLTAAAAKGTATPPQLKRLQLLKQLLSAPVSQVMARPGVGKLVKGSALTGAGLGALEGAAKLNATGIDELSGGYAALRADEEESPLSNIDPSSMFNPVGNAAANLIGLPALNRKVEDYLMEPAETSFGQAAKDTALRLGAFGKHVATRATANLLGGSPLDYREAPAAAAAAAKPEEERIDPTGLKLDYEQQQAASGDRYAGIQLPSQAGGIRAGYEAARKAVGPTDEASVGDERSYIDKQGDITEKYELDKPLKAQQTKITERRAKLDEDYSKSTLTDLGLAFLTKGVMAAGEGKDTFSAMAYAVGEGAKTTKERRERIDQIREKLDDREAMLETQLATMRENQVTRGLAARNKELDVIRDNKNKVMALSLQEVQSLLAESGRQQDAALRVTLARIQASGDADKLSAVEQLSRQYVAYSNNPNRQREAAYTLQRIKELESTSPAYQAAAARIAAEADEANRLGGGAAGGGQSATRSQADAVIAGG